MTEPAVWMTDLRVRYGIFEALHGVSLSVEPGEILAVLGPNGAGKTTLVRTCATLVPPSGGSVRIDGFDVVTEAAQVRRRIGLTGQYAALDQDLTARENLVLMGALLGVADRAQRAEHLIEQLDLGDIAERRISTLSGGSRRKADLAASMAGHPTVLFLDDPTTGLDPRARLRLWDAIEDLRSAGTTVVLTTQYLEEADRLANRIIVINRDRPARGRRAAVVGPGGAPRHHPPGEPSASGSRPAGSVWTSAENQFRVDVVLAVDRTGRFEAIGRRQVDEHSKCCRTARGGVHLPHP